MVVARKYETLVRGEKEAKLIILPNVMLKLKHSKFCALHNVIIETRHRNQIALFSLDKMDTWQEFMWLLEINILKYFLKYFMDSTSKIIHPVFRFCVSKLLNY